MGGCLIGEKVREEGRTGGHAMGGKGEERDSGGYSGSGKLAAPHVMATQRVSINQKQQLKGSSVRA